MIRILSLSNHFLPPFLIPHPKPRNQMTTDEMSSKQVRQAAPSCHRPPDHWEEDVAGERHRSRGTDRRPPRLAAPPRPPQLARVAGGHSPAPGRTAAGGGRGLGRARSCCRGDGLRSSKRLGSQARLGAPGCLRVPRRRREKTGQRLRWDARAGQEGRRRRRLLPLLGGTVRAENRSWGEGGAGAGLVGPGPLLVTAGSQSLLCTNSASAAAWGQGLRDPGRAEHLESGLGRIFLGLSQQCVI